ncbi:MAG TPA: ABC transporter permease [Gemmatimonadales bacterium]|nr:ABC transporter permease [Gemmatimonadales bacterium]
MLIGEVFAVALAAIRANKLRSALTMLGIVIGVAAVITMVALGAGAQKAVQERIQALGTDLLSVYAGQSFEHGVASANRVSLTTEDADTLAADVGSSVKAVVPEITSNMQVQLGSQNINTTVDGTTSNYVDVNNYSVLAGRMFTRGDNDGRRRVAVIGYDIPKELNSNGVAMIGQTILIRGIPFQVIGLLSQKGSQGGWDNPDDRILIPIQTARYRIFGSDRIRSITVQLSSPDSVNVAMINIERVMRRQHQIRPGQDNDFQIRNRAEFLATFQQTAQTFTFLLAGIAAVSLLVGGIGIMNIMLVSVTERTREIGVRKAMGATKRNILYQFLVEAMVLCLMGGLVGVLLGTGGAVALSKLANWNTLISPVSVIIAVAFSGVVGVFFGLWPAQRAAGLDPIVALRYE